MAQGPKMPDFGEISRKFADMKFPAMPDMGAFVTPTRRNMDVLAAANRVAMEGAQAVARRRHDGNAVVRAVRENCAGDAGHLLWGVKERPAGLSNKLAHRGRMGGGASARHCPQGRRVRRRQRGGGGGRKSPPPSWRG